MSTIQEIRRENLVLLLKRYRTIQEFANKIGRAHSQVSAIKNANKRGKSTTPRTMGDDMARDIEETLDLGHGWMDVSHKDSDAEALLQAYSRLPPEAQAQARAFLAGLAAGITPALDPINVDLALRGVAEAVRRGADPEKAVATGKVIMARGNDPVSGDLVRKSEETSPQARPR